MRLLKNEKVIDIIERTLNCIDARLIDHGKRVAYLIFKILHPQRRFDDKQLQNICILAMLHDVGAYKTEEIDKMVIFETIDIWEHSIYGYLFLKYFSPLKALAETILFHHAECGEIKHLSDDKLQLLAQLISICDRADVFSLHNGDNDDFKDYVNKHRNIKYRDDIADMFLSSGVNINAVFDDIDGDAEFNRIFRCTPLTADEVAGYINMIIFSIDFRSNQTVIHTVTATCIAGILAKMFGADENEIEKIKTGATLHDIGKIGIPVNIIESVKKLNDADMEIMKSHINITEKILDGNVSDDIKNIAVKHHERLDGSGYPRNLGADDIAFNDRIVAIADIFSALCGARSYKGAFPKEKVIEILENMSEKNLIDAQIVSLSIERFDEILKEVDIRSRPVIETYNAINEEYLKIRRYVENSWKNGISLK